MSIMHRYANTLMNSPSGRLALGSILVGCFAFLVACVLSCVRWPIPAIHDEFSYLLSADTLLHGRLANPSVKLWPVFQAEHVISQPTYASKYPLGPAALLALGQILLGTATGGLWLGAAIASATAVWMLRAILPLRWAILGGVLTALHPNMQAVWSQSYMNGWLSTSMACLTLGGVLRLRRRWSAFHGIVMSFGIGGLALCRPWEGFLSASLAMLLWLSSLGFRRLWIETHLSQKLRSTLSFSPIVAALLLIGYHNSQVTGSWRKMPYQLHEEQYGVAPLTILQAPKSPKFWHFSANATNWFPGSAWEPSELQALSALTSPNKTTNEAEPPKPRVPRREPGNERIRDGVQLRVSKFFVTHERSSMESLDVLDVVPPEIQRYHTIWSMECYRDRIGMTGWLAGCVESMGVMTQFFGISFGILPLLAWFVCSRTNVILAMSFASAAMLLASTFIPWVLPHYFGPLLPWLICLSMLTMRTLMHRGFSPVQRKIAIRRAQMSLVILQLMLFGLGFVRLARLPYPEFASNRNAIRDKLLSMEGKHLVLVRYAANHNVHEEWVYNQADLATSPIIWARSWRADLDQQLLKEYEDRRVWVIEPDRGTSSLRELGTNELQDQLALLRPL